MKLDPMIEEVEDPATAVVDVDDDEDIEKVYLDLDDDGASTLVGADSGMYGQKEIHMEVTDEESGSEGEKQEGCGIKRKRTIRDSETAAKTISTTRNDPIISSALVQRPKDEEKHTVLTNPSNLAGNPPMHFRLMDLPVELRLLVAEYVLQNHETLLWFWGRSVRTGVYKGTFKKLDTLTAITRVSRQLYAETKNLVRNLNTFEFCEWMLGAIYEYEFFVKWAPRTTRELDNTIHFQMGTDDPTSTLYDTLKTIAAFACETPTAQFTFRYDAWSLSRALETDMAPFTVEDVFDAFKARRLEIQDLKAASLSSGQVRNLRVMSASDEKGRQIAEQVLSAAELKLIDDCHKHGI
ncbi:hypothetical protein EK21DRAFT_115077 [Setomelanomma holmii]|uniref:Uncharacterized protein n=1 Tax=Setomelanomma holmii TaxID=210430 RepID=A0A9P4H484_9PLEO|nr:hypothetical protein EK21DRAFT_115077 [Setomelanomma holmii]